MKSNNKPQVIFKSFYLGQEDTWEHGQVSTCHLIHSNSVHVSLGHGEPEIL